MSKRVLFIVEGERAEPRFLTKMLGFYQIIEDHNIFSVKTNIHVIYQSLFQNNDSEDVDILQELKSRVSEKERKILSQDYSDVFLVFDAEFQDSKFNVENIRKLLDYFSESTEHGKLFLNYPMLESYKHIRNRYDLTYLDQKVTIEQIKHYKELVDQEGDSSLRSLTKYDRQTFDLLIDLNLRKLNKLCFGETNVPAAETYKKISGKEIFEAQLDNWGINGYMYVLNTSIFIITDYAPNFLLSN